MCLARNPLQIDNVQTIRWVVRRDLDDGMCEEAPPLHMHKTAPHVKEVEIPGPVHLYNHSMGGVDLNDQYRSYYPSGHSGKKWGGSSFCSLLK